MTPVELMTPIEQFESLAADFVSAVKTDLEAVAAMDAAMAAYQDAGGDYALYQSKFLRGKAYDAVKAELAALKQAVDEAAQRAFVTGTAQTNLSSAVNQARGAATRAMIAINLGAE